MIEATTRAQTSGENGLRRLKYGVSGLGMAVPTVMSKRNGGWLKSTRLKRL